MKRALPPIVKVDGRGIDAEGNDTTLHAAADQVGLGYFVNVPVLAQYPGGGIRDGNIVRITPSGIEHLRRALPLDVRRPGGAA